MVAGSGASELIGAALGDLRITEQEARAILEAALTLEVDPLDYLVQRSGLGEHAVLARAAHWAGFAFSPAIPAGPPIAEFPRLDLLAGRRVLRGRLFDRDIVYMAPRFEDLLRLRTAAGPDLRRRVCLVPARALRAEFARLLSEPLLAESRQRLTRRWPKASAAHDLGLPARLAFVGTAAAIVLATVAAGTMTSAWVTLPVDVVLVVPALFRVLAVGRAALTGKAGPRLPPLADTDLPIYSVLIPLRDEAAMVPQLHRAMTRLDYPPEKLDIKFVVEEKSKATLAAIRPLLADARFELVVVPDGVPRTKPKALAYALPFARGEHLVVYDAEDIPAPDQLRAAASRFAAEPGVDCLQAELVLDNAAENLLTALFAGEYAGQFGLMLPALACWRLPMPLGGTSNHFRLAALKEVGAWDAFNVTEDADLGVRLARLRYRTGTLVSRTREEAPVSLGAWMAQRTRWTKGWMQTFIVHNRHGRAFFRDIGWRGWLAFQIYVAGLILSAPLHTAFVATLVLRLTFFPAPLDPMAAAVNAIVIVIGYGGSLVLAVAGLLRLRAPRLIVAQLLLPAYWLLHSAAAARASWELLTRPYFWAKTAHGRTRLDRDGAGPPDHADRIPYQSGRTI